MQNEFKHQHGFIDPYILGFLVLLIGGVLIDGLHEGATATDKPAVAEEVVEAPEFVAESSSE